MSEQSMKGTTVRWDPDAYTVIDEAASIFGISVAQFVREAALMRALILLSRAHLGERELLDHGGREFIQAMHEVSERVVKLSEVQGGPVHRGYVPPRKPPANPPR